MSEVRRYRFNLCKGCGNPNCVHASDRPVPITAIDQRDVEPLVEAARNAVKELDYAPPGESERDSSCRIKSKWWLESTLAPFDRSNLNPSQPGASGEENLRISKDDFPDQPSGER